MAKAPTFKSLREAAEAGYHGKAVNIEGKGLQKVAFADEAYDKRMAERSARANESGGSTGSRRPQARPSRAPEESPRPTARRRVERDPQDASPTTRARPPVQRDPRDASPTTRARPPIRREAQDASPTRSAVGEMPASIQRLLDEVPGGAARARADRIADQVAAGRMPLREAINRINELFSNVRGAVTDRSEEMRQRRAAAGMAKGGMVKKGKTDRRGKGMFYDSKSPRGYK